MLKIVGHRGAKGLAPENTVAAIRKALEHHVNEIEIDVRVTRDQIAVVHHGTEVHDQTGTGYSIRNHTFQELVAHKPDLPTLQQVLAATNRAVPLQIEVKKDEPLPPIIQVIQQHLQKGWQLTDLLLGSKSHRSLMELHRQLPDIPKVVIEPFSGLRASWRIRQLNKLAGHRTTRISMRATWLWSGFIKAVYHGGHELYAYTLNDPAKARRWEKYGLAGAITDYPDLFDSSQPQHTSRSETTE
jgi:glycerophosphoryl diester phosphodiesterase